MMIEKVIGEFLQAKNSTLNHSKEKKQLAFRWCGGQRSGFDPGLRRLKKND